MPEPTFSPGFRLSALDVVILVTGTAAAGGFASVDGWIGVGVAWVVGHFFLFCNVLRLSRPPELLWAATFCGLAVAASGFGAIPWPLALAVSFGLTLILAAAEMRRPSYHGVGWCRLNPTLPQWWATQGGREVLP